MQFTMIETCIFA